MSNGKPIEPGITSVKGEIGLLRLDDNTIPLIQSILICTKTQKKGKCSLESVLS